MFEVDFIFECDSMLWFRYLFRLELLFASQTLRDALLEERTEVLAFVAGVRRFTLISTRSYKRYSLFWSLPLGRTQPRVAFRIQMGFAVL